MSLETERCCFGVVFDIEDLDVEPKNGGDFTPKMMVYNGKPY